jgi:hypothetical protein
LMSPVPTIRPENPGNRVELDGTGVSCFDHREPSDSDSGWSSLVSPLNESSVLLATPTCEALVASTSNDFVRLHLCTGHPGCAPLVGREHLSPQNAGASAPRQSPERRT